MVRYYCLEIKWDASLVVIWSEFRMIRYRHDDHRKKAPHFISSTYSGLYASSREKCCGGKVISERKGCCGTGPKAVEYDPRFMGCCKTRTWAQSYDPSGQICCGNRVIKKDGKVSISSIFPGKEFSKGAFLIESSIKWTVLSQNGRSMGVKLDGSQDSKWTVPKSESGRFIGRRLVDLNGWNWTV